MRRDIKTVNKGVGTAFICLRCRLYHVYIAACLSKCNYDALREGKQAGDRTQTYFISIRFYQLFELFRSQSQLNIPPTVKL
jgi:hypothetical protein